MPLGAPTAEFTVAHARSLCEECASLHTINERSRVIVCLSLLLTHTNMKKE